MTTNQMPNDPPVPGKFVPQADTTLAALAVLEHYTKGEVRTVEALLASMDDKELVVGLLDLSRHLASMLAKSIPTTEQTIVDHLRQMLLKLINSGEFSAG